MNKSLQACILLLALLLLAGCSNPTPVPETATPTSAPTPTLPDPMVRTTSVPSPLAVAQAYLDAWKSEDYPSMYAMLSKASQAQIDEEAFTKRYRDVVLEAAVGGIGYNLYAPVTNPGQAQVGYEVMLQSAMVGEIHSATDMGLVMEDGQWKVEWDEAMILAELEGGNRLQMQINTPPRANIYDRNGNLLAGVGEAVAIGIKTGQIDEETENGMLETIRSATGVRADSLRPKINAYRGNDWYLPVADLAVSVLGNAYNSLARYTGIQLIPFTARYYFYGASAAHAVGYASLIQAEELETFKRRGYNVWSDKVGRAGLEAWGEPYLSGKRGGALNLIGPSNDVIDTLASVQSQPAQDIYTTLDANLQAQVQRALGDFRGAIVVLERDTGRVLAMASAPGFNPNLFEPANFNYQHSINDVFDPITTPRLNRAAEAQYPLGSVFKIITMAAALDSGVYTPQSEYECGYHFTELPGVTLNDWTYERFLKDEKTPPSGLLNLPQGLMRSCNPWFWHIGLDLFDRGMTTNISEMARGFGLGSKTGIEIEEIPGQIPDPNERMDGTNIAIGQGNVLVTPLQVANFIAAMGNGGYLYEPSLVERIGPELAPSYVFTPTVRSELPISPEIRDIINEAMFSVVSNSRGTANHVLGAFSRGYGIPIAAKTGTAESGTGDPHSWFAGYTNGGRENRPDIAVAVLVENIGEGSEYAAPIFKRVMEIYFAGRPLSRYAWESEIGVKKTPTPEPAEAPVVEETPAPEATETPSP